MRAARRFAALLARSIACGLLLAGAAASAQTRNGLPPAVQKDLAGTEAICREVGGRPLPSPQWLTAADLNGDGLADYLVQEGEFRCEGQAALFSGTAGSRMSVYLSRPSGDAIQVLTVWGFGARLDASRRPTLLQLSVEGPLCGQVVTDDLPHSAYWSCWRSLIWNRQKQTLEFAPLTAQGQPR